MSVILLTNKFAVTLPLSVRPAVGDIAPKAPDISVPVRPIQIFEFKSKLNWKHNSYFSYIYKNSVSKPEKTYF